MKGNKYEKLWQSRAYFYHTKLFFLFFISTTTIGFEVDILQRDIFPDERMILVRCRIDDEDSVTMGNYDHSHFRDIFPEERLKKYLEELEKMWNQNAKCEMC